MGVGNQQGGALGEVDAAQIHLWGIHLVFSTPATGFLGMERHPCVRQLAVNLMSYKSGDGCHTRFFLDPWLNRQPLISRMGERLRQDLACDLSSHVCRFITNRCWNLPQATTVEMHELWLEVLAIPLSVG